MPRCQPQAPTPPSSGTAGLWSSFLDWGREPKAGRRAGDSYLVQRRTPGQGEGLGFQSPPHGLQTLGSRFGRSPRESVPQPGLGQDGTCTHLPFHLAATATVASLPVQRGSPASCFGYLPQSLQATSLSLSPFPASLNQEKEQVLVEDRCYCGKNGKGRKGLNMLADPALGRATILGREGLFPASLAALWGPLRPDSCQGNGSILGKAKFSELQTSLSHFLYHFLRKACNSSVRIGRFRKISVSERN